MQIIQTALQSTVGRSPRVQTWPFDATTSSNSNITLNVLQGFVAFQISLLLKKSMYPHSMGSSSS